MSEAPETFELLSRLPRQDRARAREPKRIIPSSFSPANFLTLPTNRFSISSSIWARFIQPSASFLHLYCIYSSLETLENQDPGHIYHKGLKVLSQRTGRSIRPISSCHPSKFLRASFVIFVVKQFKRDPLMGENLAERYYYE